MISRHEASPRATELDLDVARVAEGGHRPLLEGRVDDRHEVGMLEGDVTEGAVGVSISASSWTDATIWAWAETRRSSSTIARTAAAKSRPPSR